eukprot:TRINITY_DN1302_c0_g1_i8.p1 TRINITY_DN1302_c0_g1~~TRINITY_DN1302_c0_g1_i8.p1  ORF type:complete len:133 (+),score=6.60 TRINITY_DN1302_c0_g1_i8:110-508(+)
MYLCECVINPKVIVDEGFSLCIGCAAKLRRRKILYNYTKKWRFKQSKVNELLVVTLECGCVINDTGTIDLATEITVTKIKRKFSLEQKSAQCKHGRKYTELEQYAIWGGIKIVYSIAFAGHRMDELSQRRDS